MAKSMNLIANEVLFALKRLYDAENDPARDHDAIAIISDPLREAAAEIERLRAALERLAGDEDIDRSYSYRDELVARKKFARDTLASPAEQSRDKTGG